MAEAQQLERSFVGPPKKLIKRRYDREKRSRSSTKKRNMFSWENVDGVRIPYIFRGDRKYVLVSVVNEQLLARYPRWYPEEIRNCPPLLSVGITAEEADMLNQMEKRIFGNIGGPFLTGDLIVELDAALSFYATLRDHYQKGGSAPTPKEGAAAAPPRGPTPSQQPATPVDVNDVSVASADGNTNIRAYVPGYSVGYMHVIPDGWILVNNAVVPCIRRITAAGQFKLLPLPVVEEGIGKLDVGTEILSSPVECFVLSAMCRAVGHQFTFPAGLKLVGLGTVLESKNDVFLHRLSDQDPFQCASDIINRRIKDDELVDDLLSPTYGNKATSANLAFAEENERPSCGQQNSVTIALDENVSRVDDLRTVNNKTGNNSSPNVKVSSDEGFAEDCEILDLSTHRSRRPPEPGYDMVPKPVDLSEKSGCDRTKSTNAVTGTSTEPATDDAMKEEPAASESSFQTPADGYVNHSAVAQPVVENASCVSLPTKELAAYETKTTAHVTDTHATGASPTNTAVVSGSDVIPVQAADTRPVDVPGSSVQCNDLTVGPGKDLQSMIPPAVIPRGKKRKTSQKNADVKKRKIIRNCSKPKKELLLTCLINQNGQRPGVRLQETRKVESESGPCSLYALALKKCKSVYGERFAGAGRSQPEENPLKGHLKKWLLMKSYKVKPEVQRAAKRVADDRAESSSTKKAKLQKSARRRSKLDGDHARPTDAVVIPKAAPSSGQNTIARNTPRDPMPKPTSSHQQGVPGPEPSKPTATRRLPTLCELVDEINKPPVKFKRKCPFTDINSLPKLPFLGLGGPHTLSSADFGIQQKPPVKKGIRVKLPLHKRRKHSTSGVQIRKSSSGFVDDTAKPASAQTSASDPEARRDSGISENTDGGGHRIEPNPSSGTGPSGSDNCETSEGAEGRGHSPESKDVSDVPTSKHSGAVCSLPASASDLPLGRVDHTKQALDGNHLIETSSIIAQTNQLLDGRTNCGKEMLPLHCASDGHCSTEAQLRQDYKSSKSDVMVADGTAATPFRQNCIPSWSSCGDKDCNDGKAQVSLISVNVTQATNSNASSTQCAVLSHAVDEVNPVSKDNHISSSGNLMLRPVTDAGKSHNMADHVSKPSNATLRPVAITAISSGGANNVIGSQNTVLRPVADVLKRSGGASGSINPLLRPVNNAGGLLGGSTHLRGARIPMLRPVMTSGQAPVRTSHTGGLINPMLRPVTDIAQLSGAASHIGSTENSIIRPVSEIAIASGGAGHVIRSVNNVAPSSIVVNQVFDSVDKTALAVGKATIGSGNVNDGHGSSSPVIRSVHHRAVPLDVKDHIKAAADISAASVSKSVPTQMRLVNALGGYITRGMPLPVLKPVCTPVMALGDGGRVTGKPGAFPEPASNGALLSGITNHAVGISESGTMVRTEAGRTTVIPFSPVSDVEEEHTSDIDGQTGTLKESGIRPVTVTANGGQHDTNSSLDTKQIPVSETATPSGGANCVEGSSRTVPDPDNKEDASASGRHSTSYDVKPVSDVEKCTNGVAQNNPGVNGTQQPNECLARNKPAGVASGSNDVQAEVRRAEEAAVEQTDSENGAPDRATSGRQVVTPGDEADK